MSRFQNEGEIYLLQQIGEFVVHAHLFVNEPDVEGGNLTWADFDEPDFAGYGEVECNFETPTIINNVAVMNGTTAGVFRGTGEFTAQHAKGFFLTIGGVDDLVLFAELWDEEYVFEDASNPLMLDFTLSLGDTADICPLEPATHFLVEVEPEVDNVVSFLVNVTALNDHNQVDVNYTGLVHFDSLISDPPGDSYLVNGSGSSFAGSTELGDFTITATDTDDPSITGTSGNIHVV